MFPQINSVRRPVVGRLEAGARGLRHQEAADHVRGRRRQGGHRLSRGGDHKVRRPHSVHGHCRFQQDLRY